MNKKAFRNLLVGTSVLAAMTACKGDYEAPVIESVWINMVTRPVEEVTCAYPGETICVRGEHLGDLRRVIVNGTDINLNTLFVYESSSAVTFSLPSDVNTEGDYIRLVTKWGMDEHPFIIRPASGKPVISAFSATTLIPGRILTVSGSNLEGVSEVWLPLAFGERVQCELDGTQDAGGKTVNVVVPEGVSFATGRCEIIMQKHDDARGMDYTEKVYSDKTAFRGIGSLPDYQNADIPEGVALDPEQLFGTWEGSLEVGEDNTNHFEQSYRIDFQSVEDAEALFSHWFTDAASSTRDSVCNLSYTYTFDGKSLELTPKASAIAKGASIIKAVHVGENNMVLYSVKEKAATSFATLKRTGDPEPAITSVDRTLPLPGQKVTFTGRNLQFVDHVYLPAADGELEVTSFDATSRQISFILPDGSYTSGHVRFFSSGAHVNAWSPAMFCTGCVFFHSFTEFDNTINITQSSMDKIKVVQSASLPEGHCLQGADVINPETMLCYFGNTPQAWAVDTGLDPSTGMLRFSFGDKVNYAIEHSGGMLTAKSKCKDVAIEMDIYVSSDGAPLWDTGFMSFRLDKDQGKSLTQGWFGQTAMWDMDAPVSFEDGWKTYTIPLSAFRITESESYSTLGGLASFLLKNKKQTIVKLLNYQLDELHPAHALNSFQFCIADMRLVPYGVPANTKEIQ